MNGLQVIISHIDLDRPHGQISSKVLSLLERKRP